MWTRACAMARVSGHGLSNLAMIRNNTIELLQSQFDLLSLLQDGI